MRATIHKCENSGSGIIFREKDLVQFCCDSRDITLYEMWPWPTISRSAGGLTYNFKVSWWLDLQFQGQLGRFYCQHKLVKVWLKPFVNSRYIIIYFIGELNMYFQVQLIWKLCCWWQCRHFYERLVKIGRIMQELQRFLLYGDIDLHFPGQMMRHFLLPTAMPSLF